MANGITSVVKDILFGILSSFQESLYLTVCNMIIL